MVLRTFGLPHSQRFTPRSLALKQDLYYLEITMEHIMLHAFHFITPFLNKHGFHLATLVALYRFGVLRHIWNIGYKVVGVIYITYACIVVVLRKIRVFCFWLKNRNFQSINNG